MVQKDLKWAVLRPQNIAHFGSPTLRNAHFNPYPWIFGTITERVFWKKNSESALVTSQLGLRKWKLHVQIQCQLGYLMILISNGICQYEGKYAALKKNICHFLGPSPSVISGKKIHSTETYTNWFNAAFWIFFPQNTPGHGPAFWIFFPGFTDKG